MSGGSEGGRGDAEEGFNHGGANKTGGEEREEILLFHNNPFRSTKPKIVLSSISQTSVTSSLPHLCVCVCVTRARTHTKGSGGRNTEDNSAATSFILIGELRCVQVSPVFLPPLLQWVDLLQGRALTLQTAPLQINIDHKDCLRLHGKCPLCGSDLFLFFLNRGERKKNDN